MPSFEILLPITQAFHWELKPFFHLFRKFWIGNQQVTILSDVDPQIPNTRFVPIRHTIAVDWSGVFSNNLSSYLKHDAQSNYVIILMADYWLTDFVRVSLLRTLVRFMTDNPQVIRLQISNGMDSASSEVVCNYGKTEIRTRPEFFRGSLIPGLWSRKLLIEYLRPNLDLWGTEQVLSRDIEKSKRIKSYLVMPEIIKYDHICKTSTRLVNFISFPQELRNEIAGFIPNNFTIYR